MSRSKIVLVKYNDDSHPLDTGDQDKSAKEKRLREVKSARTSIEIEPDEKGSQANAPIIDARQFRPPSPTIKKLRATIDSRSEAASKFQEMMSSLAEIIPDEATRQAAALAAVHKSSKFTSSQVLSSLEGRLKLLDAEAKALAEENEQVKKEIAKHHAERREKEELIAKLTKQIAAVEAEKKEIEAKASKKEGAYRATASDLKDAVGTLREELEAENRVFLNHFKKA